MSNSVNNKLLQVEGVDTAELAVYPSLETAAQSTPSSSSGASASFLSSLLSDFTRENDFQRLLPNLAELDANDPLNDYLLYLKSKRLSAVSGDYFRLGGLDYAVPFLSPCSSRRPSAMAATRMRCGCSTSSTAARSRC